MDRISVSICLLISLVGLRDGTIPTGKKGPVGHLPTHSAVRLTGRKLVPKSSFYTVVLLVNRM